MCAIMPKHIAETDPFKQITEVVGSGPFRFKADERVQGAFFAYERFDQYKPRENGEISFTAGPKIVHFDRVEWHVQPDVATKAGLVGLTPATHLALLGDGSGRPNDPKMQELREAWFDAPDLTIRRKIGEQMQLQAFENVPYYPLGLAQIPAAVRRDIADIPDGYPLFWNVRRT
jgi:ABC-type transport system substrate-binding protein